MAIESAILRVRSRRFRRGKRAALGEYQCTMPVPKTPHGWRQIARECPRTGGAGGCTDSVPSKGQRLGHSRAGPIASFIDVVGDFAIGMLVGGGVPTINPRIDYLRPAIGETITGTGRVRRQGRTVALVDIEITDREGKLVAIGRGTYAPQVG